MEYLTRSVNSRDPGKPRKVLLNVPVLVCVCPLPDSSHRASLPHPPRPPLQPPFATTEMHWRAELLPERNTVITSRTLLGKNGNVGCPWRTGT